MIEEIEQVAKVFPVRDVAVTSLLSMKALESAANPSNLWQLQQAVFDARMDALQYMIREDYQPVGDAAVYIDIRVRQRAVSREAGDIGCLPESLTHIRAYVRGDTCT